MNAALFLCFAFVGCALAAHSHHNIQGLINHEVKALLHGNKDLTVDHCSTKCDALFDLGGHQDEAYTDTLCLHACQCQIKNNNCHAAGHHSTQHPHHSHKPHTTTPSAPYSTTTIGF